MSIAVAVPVIVGKDEVEQFMVTLAGQVMIGGVVSCFRILWTQVDVLPHPSDATQVRVMVESQEVPDFTSL